MAQSEALMKQGRIAEAIGPSQEALELTQRESGQDSPNSAKTLLLLAGLYLTRMQFSEAESLYKRSVAISEKVYGEDSAQTVIPVTALAGIYTIQGRYDEAETLLQRSLSAIEEARSKDHFFVTMPLGSLATLYTAQGKHAEAEAVYRRVLPIYEKVHGKDDPFVARIVSYQADLCRAQGKHEEAEALLTQSLVSMERSSGKNHPDVLIPLNGLASLYATQRQYAKAEDLYRQSLAIVETTYGETHPDVAKALRNLAALHRTQGNHTEAEDLLRRSLAISEISSGRDSHEVTVDLGGLAALYHSQGRCAEADPLYRRVMKTWEKNLGRDIPPMVGVLTGMAECSEQMGKIEEAKGFRARVLQIKSKQRPPLTFELVDDDVTEKEQRPLSTNEMIGTWKLVYAKWGGIRDDTPKRFTVLNHQNATHSIHVWINPESKQVAEVFGGMSGPAWPTYGFGGVFERMRNRDHPLTYRIEGNKWYNTGWLADGMAIEEVWERIPGEKEQTSHKLIGSWKLVHAKYNGRESDLPESSATLKLVTPTQTIWLRIDPVSKRVVTVSGGLNSLMNDTCIENADYGFGVDFERTRGERLSFTWKVEHDKWYNRSSDGRMIEEVWERVGGPIKSRP